MNGEEIKALRLKQGLTQQGLADVLRVRVTTVWRWENGKRQPQGKRLHKLRELARAVSA